MIFNFYNPLFSLSMVGTDPFVLAFASLFCALNAMFPVSKYFKEHHLAVPIISCCCLIICRVLKDFSA